ncbi:MAG: hypothetical protein JNK38_04700 [Acidobacteria bacterium]|nr:hypothetical protein [Acidobacteriota bacterium]
MSDKLHKQIAVELQQLNHLLEVHQPLLDKCANEAPSEIEISALAAMLHSFYTGIENIFKRIVLESGEALPVGEAWHRSLLDLITRPGSARTAVISTPLRDKLREYLRFRHVFRQAYSFDLRWDKMGTLVLACVETLRLLEAELGNWRQTNDKELE